MQPARPREVGLAFDEILRPVRLEGDARDRTPVDRREARPHHRHQFGRRQAALREERPDRVAFVGADVDHEIVRRACGQAGLPVAQQVVAHQREQQQHHEAETERDDLHDAVAAAPRNVGEPVAPRDADAATQWPQRLHQQPARGRQQHERGGQAARDVRHQPRVADDPVQQGEHGADGDAIDRRVTQRRRFQVATQHARRRHALQAQQRRQREPDQHDDRGDQAEPVRPQRRRRQVVTQQVAQQPRDAPLGDVAQRRAEHADGGRDHHQLEDRLAQHEALRRAHAFHQRDIVEMPAGVTLRRHGDCDRRQQHAHQAREREKASGLVARRADLRAGVCDALQPLARLLLRLQLLAKGRDVRRIAGKQYRAA